MGTLLKILGFVVLFIGFIVGYETVNSVQHVKGPWGILGFLVGIVLFFIGWIIGIDEK